MPFNLDRLNAMYFWKLLARMEFKLTHYWLCLRLFSRCNSR
jgi:hypothetical protein